MFRMNLKQRLLAAIALIFLMTMSICWMNYRALTAQKENIVNLAHWGDIDMVTNEDVIARLGAAQAAFLYWSTGPDESRWKEVEKALKEAEEGIGRWKRLVLAEEGFSEAADRLDRLFTRFKSTLSTHVELQRKREERLQSLKQQGTRVEALLQEAMERVIDPGKEKADALGDVREMALWSNIDMIMNEEIVQQLLSFWIALDSYLARGKGEQEVTTSLGALESGVKDWTKLVRGKPELEQLSVELMDIVGKISGLWSEVKVMTREMNQQVLEVMSTVEGLNAVAEEIMQELVDPAKAHTVSRAIEGADRNILISLVQLAMVLCIMGLVAIGANRTSRPIQALINKLKDLSVGEADLTRQLPVTPVNCSNLVQCGRTECPSYSKEGHCWYVSGSYAPDEYTDRFKKGECPNCETCQVYKQAVVTELDEVSSFVNAFISRIRKIVAQAKMQGDEVAAEAQNMSTVSDQMTGAAVEAQSHAKEVSRVAEIAGESVSTVAAAMEEMTATVSEVAQHTAQASQVAQDANDEATRTQQVIHNLAKASDKISEVSKLIGSIAEQTNLLALNATI